MIRIGDIVGRKSYGCDVLFRVVALSQGERPMAELRAVCLRLVATAPVDDLVRIQGPDEDRYLEEQRTLRLRKTERTRKRIVVQREKSLKRTYAAESVNVGGTVLHLDGDSHYVRECESFYRSLGVSAVCRYVPENRQAQEVASLINQYRPNIVVLTGHDGKQKGPGQDNLGLYHNSRAFVDAVKKVREVSRSLDDTPVVAGACQSFYEAILAAGANFASSPGRILIDIFDPCIIACELAELEVREYIQPETAVLQTQGTAAGMGGLETRGQMRVLYPAPRGLKGND